MKQSKIFGVLAVVGALMVNALYVPAYSWSHDDHNQWGRSVRSQIRHSNRIKKIQRHRRERICDHFKDHWDDHHHHHHHHH